MRSAQLVLLAAFAAAVAVYLIVAPRRHHTLVKVVDSGHPSSGLRGWLTPVEGAPSTVTRAAAAAIVGCVVFGVQGEASRAVLLGGLLGIVVFVGLGRLGSPARRREELAVVSSLPAVCTLLAVCLEAGLPLRNAVAAVAQGLRGPVGEVLSRLDAAVGLGTPEQDAWHELGRRHPAFESLARELGHAAGSGVALAPLLRQHAREAQRTLHAAAQARARRAGVSSVMPLMVCFLPAFLLIGVVPIIAGAALHLFG